MERSEKGVKKSKTSEDLKNKGVDKLHSLVNNTLKQICPPFSSSFLSIFRLYFYTTRSQFLRFVDFVVWKRESGSWLKQECLIPACYHITVGRQIWMQTSLFIIHTVYVSARPFEKTYMYFSHNTPAVKPYENNPAYDFLPMPPSSSFSSHTDQQLVKC